MAEDLALQLKARDLLSQEVKEVSQFTSLEALRQSNGGMKPCISLGVIFLLRSSTPLIESLDCDKRTRFSVPIVSLFS